MNRLTWIYKRRRRKAVKACEYIALQFGPTEYLYWKVVPAFYRIRLGRRYDEFSCPLDPFKVCSVDPQSIDRITGRSDALLKRDSLGRVVEGEWDRKGKENWYGTNPADPIERIFTGKLFTDTVFYTSLERHFKENVPWYDTKLYQILADGLEHRTSVLRGCTSESELEARFSEIDEMYHRIQSDEYRTQRELRASSSEINAIGFLGEITNEVCVDIGHDGELLFVDGKHRLAIAKLLELERIPVAFLTRHRDWMEFRERVYERNEHVSHPDLRTLREL